MLQRTTKQNESSVSEVSALIGETTVQLRKLTLAEKRVVFSVQSNARHQLLRSFLDVAASTDPFHSVRGVGVSDGIAGVILTEQLIAVVTNARSSFSDHSDYGLDETIGEDKSIFFGASGLSYSSLWKNRFVSTTNYENGADPIDLVQPDATNDLYSGSAGTLLAMVSLSRLKPAVTENLSIRVESRALAERIIFDLRRSSANPSVAHGSAGMLLSLLAYYERYRDDDLQESLRDACELVASAIRFEREVPQWVDRRGDTDAGFCNGTSGILIVALLGARLLNSAAFAHVLDQLIKTTSTFTPAPPHFCCGYAGQSAALIAAYRDIGDMALLKRAMQFAEASAISFLQSPTDVSLFRGSASVALMSAFLDYDHFPEFPLLNL